MILTAVIITLLGLFLLLSNHPLIKALKYGYPDSNDFKRNTNSIINKGNDNYQFEKYIGEINYGTYLIYDDWKLENALKKNLTTFVKEHKSTSFIIIKKNKILYEEYFEDYNKDTLVSSYSIAKSILSLLVGKAIEDGKIKDLNQSIVQYITELKDIKKFNEVKIIDLLNHTSGIKSDLIMDGYLYYGDSVWKAIEKIKFNKNPGTFQEYLNMNSQLLGILLSRATNSTLSEYFSNQIWRKIGATQNAYWSTFKKDNIEKCFCCISALPIDFAKIGKLILNDGYWNGKKIIDPKWMSKISSRSLERGSSRSYNMSWYLGLEKYNDIMAIGLYKQFIYVCKVDDIVIVRFGNREKKLFEEKARWPRMFRETVDQL